MLRLWGLEMQIEKIEISGSGWITCRSDFYTVDDVMRERDLYSFMPGINVLHGECDSGIWGISYLLSMYQYERNNRKHVIHSPLIATVNGRTISLNQLWDVSCYMAFGIDPVFTSRKTVRQLVQRSIKKNHLSESVEDIQRIFHIEDTRFDCPLQATGFEVFRMMAAIGYCNQKEIFCFPWISERRFTGFTGPLHDALRVLESLRKVVIFPIEKGVDIDEFWRTPYGSELFQKYWSDSEYQDLYTDNK